MGNSLDIFNPSTGRVSYQAIMRIDDGSVLIYESWMDCLALFSTSKKASGFVDSIGLTGCSQLRVTEVPDDLTASIDADPSGRIIRTMKWRYL